MLTQYAEDFQVSRSQLLRRRWRKKLGRQLLAELERDFKPDMKRLQRGCDVASAQTRHFDNWVWLTDRFPYTAWHTQLWSTHGFQDVLDFYRQEPRVRRMWQARNSSRKSYFNYCKLTVIGGGGQLADEVNAAEGLTRFFAGTFTACKLSTWALGVSLVVQAAGTIWGLFASRAGHPINLVLDLKTQTINLVVSLGLAFLLVLTCRRILLRFRGIRQKEAETVFHAYYLHTTHLSKPDLLEPIRT